MSPPDAPAFKVAVLGVKFKVLDIEAGVLDRFDARLVRGEGTDAESIVATAQEADAVLTGTLPKFTAEVLRRLRSCRAIVRYGVGVDNIDGEAAKSLGVQVLNVTDYSTQEVATHTVALILALNRRLFAANADVRSGAWRTPRQEGIKSPQDEVVGIVGGGTIGTRVGEMLLALGFRCQVHDPYKRVDWAPALELDELLATSDYVTLHVPLDEASQHMVDARAFSLMRPGSAIVNTARGGLIDQAALLAALESGRLRGAALDVFEDEPLDPASGLLQRDDVIVSPHIAWYSERSEKELRRRAAEQVALVLAGAGREAR